MNSPQSWISHGGVSGHLLPDPVRLHAGQPEQFRLGPLPRDLSFAAARACGGQVARARGGQVPVGQVPAPGAGPAQLVLQFGFHLLKEGRKEEMNCDPCTYQYR